jgi:cyanophycinase-like exopeptidase
VTNDSGDSVRPLYLLADSQLLFWRHRGRLLLDTALDGLPRDEPVRAAYIGASNGDQPEYYELFEAALEGVRVAERRMIRSAFDNEDRAFLRHAQLIVLAGGDVRRGWETFERTGMKEVILDRYASGAVLVGVSAGAVQLGRYGVVEAAEGSPGRLFDVFHLVPMVIDTHDDQGGWSRLIGAIQRLDGAVSGLGIPAGGGVVVHPDLSFEPLRRPAHEFRLEGNELVHNLLMPEDPDL